MSMLVIPLIVWGIKVHVDNITQTKDLAALVVKADTAEKEVEALKTAKVLLEERISRLVSDVKKNGDMGGTIQANTIALAKLETKIDGTNDTLKDILEILRTP
jgi:hypothetical protein